MCGIFMMRYSLPLSRLSKTRYFVLILTIIVFSYYISANWYQLSLIHGESMSPSYHNMQFVIIDRHSKDYTYGDVITFRCDNLNSVLVKRVVACPGDVLVIQDGTLYVNNTISDVYGQEYMFEYSGIARESMSLGTNQYFVIGDNIGESKDSRYEEVGMIYEDNILGRVVPQRYLQE